MSRQNRDQHRKSDDKPLTLTQRFLGRSTILPPRGKDIELPREGRPKDARLPKSGEDLGETLKSAVTGEEGQGTGEEAMTQTTGVFPELSDNVKKRPKPRPPKKGK